VTSGTDITALAIGIVRSQIIGERSITKAAFALLHACLKFLEARVISWGVFGGVGRSILPTFTGSAIMSILSPDFLSCRSPVLYCPFFG